MTYFQVTAEHLKIAQGNVRCGHCRNVFSALGNLTEHLPEPNKDDSANFEDDDFLTDEELGEFEDFDTNIYDDEDSIFDAFIDEDDSSTTEPAQDKTQPEKAAQPAPAAKPRANTIASARPSSPASEEASTSAIKKLASLREGQKAYLEKLQQAMREREQEELERQTKIFTAPKEPVTSTVKTQDTANPPQSKQAPVTPTPSKAAPAARPKPTPAQTPAPAAKPATAAAPSRNISTSEKATRPAAKASQATTRSAETNAFVDVRNTLTRKPDIPVQSGSDDVDFDTALQDLDELEINDEHADFVASVIKEFEATNITTKSQATSSATFEEPSPSALANEAMAASSPVFNENVPRPNPTVANENFAVSPGTQTPLETPPVPVEAKTSKAKKFGWKTGKPNTKKKVRKKRLKKAALKPPPQPVIEADIPTLPAILREGYQDEIAQHRMTPATIAWSVGSMLLMLVFLGQTVYFKHDQLAHISTLRPWIERFCHHFDCEISLQYDASELELLGQDIRSLPNMKNALMVSTTIINKADYRQAYPGLQITFTDMNGQTVAMRRFLPEEYLPRGTNIKLGIPPNTPVQVELQLMDPGSNAINFEFEFFKTI